MNFFTNLDVSDYLKLIKNSKCTYIKGHMFVIGETICKRGDNVLDCDNYKKIINSVKITSKKIRKYDIWKWKINWKFIQF